MKDYDRQYQGTMWVIAGLAILWFGTIFVQFLSAVGR